MPLPLPEQPFQEWTQDAVTGLPMTKRGNDAIQVYVERLCKLKHFVAGHKSDGAKELAASFVHTVVRAHGVPLAIVSDRDPRFTASYYAELSKLLGTDLRMSTLFQNGVGTSLVTSPGSLVPTKGPVQVRYKSGTRLVQVKASFTTAKYRYKSGVSFCTNVSPALA
jgi:hypothetical protein